MDRGLVRKVDELGRVVIPKEMRRVLGISTGSSIEMFINGEDITLKKFSEIANIMDFAVKTADVIYEKFCLPVLVCDDEKILVAKGTKKKLEGQKFFVSSQSREVFVTKSTSVFKIEGDVTFDFTYIFPICIFRSSTLFFKIFLIFKNFFIIFFLTFMKCIFSFIKYI